MNFTKSGMWSVGLAMSAVLSASTLLHAQTTPAKVTKLKKILLLDKSQFGAGGHRESRADLVKALSELATANGFTVTTIGQNDAASKITTEFSAANLATYQAVIFSNNDGVHQQITGTERTNLETYVKNGGALIPVHAASAFIEGWAWLSTNLVKSFFGPHGSNQPRANVAHDPEGNKDGTETKGIYKGLTAPLAFLDEYYSFNGTPRGTAGVTILTTVDERSFSAPVQGPMGNDHPVNWVKIVEKGKVIHISMGHSWSTNNVYTASNSYFKNFFYGVLRYAAGDFVGCTDNNYVEYNADATKSDQAACVTPKEPASLIYTSKSSYKAPFISQSNANQSIRVKFVSEGSHEVVVTDLKGQKVDSRLGNGPTEYSLATPKKSGFYLVKAKANGKTHIQRITVL